MFVFPREILRSHLHVSGNTVIYGEKPPCSLRIELCRSDDTPLIACIQLFRYELANMSGLTPIGVSYQSRIVYYASKSEIAHNAWLLIANQPNLVLSKAPPIPTIQTQDLLEFDGLE